MEEIIDDDTLRITCASCGRAAEVRPAGVSQVRFLKSYLQSAGWLIGGPGEPITCRECALAAAGRAAAPLAHAGIFSRAWGVALGGRGPVV